MEAPKLEEPFSGARGILLPELRRRVAPPHPAIVARMVVGGEFKGTWRRMSRFKPRVRCDTFPNLGTICCQCAQAVTFLPLLSPLIALIDGHDMLVITSQAMDDRLALSMTCVFGIDWVTSNSLRSADTMRS
jgi:hypothetical protein